MEAASIPRQAKRKRPSVKALVAAAAYAGAFFYAVSLVEDAWNGAPPLAETPGIARAATPSEPSDLALRTVAARADRSVVSVAGANGFVAWTYRGSALVVTSGDFEQGQGLTVERGTNSWVGEVIRVDAGRKLAVVRVDGTPGPALWQTRRPAGVEQGESLVAVAGEGGVQLAVDDPRHEALHVGVRPGAALRGAPVLNGSGRLVGVATREKVVPIGRLCGPIRKC